MISTLNSRSVRRASLTIALLFVCFASLACQSGGRDAYRDGPGGDPALAYTCRLASKQVSASDPVFGRINAIRKRRGAGPLFYDRDLSRAAQAHAVGIAGAGRIDHRAGPSERLRKRGLVRRYVAENLARFEHTADPRDYVVRYWTAGEPEFTNLVSRRYVRVGFGLQATPSHCYAVLILTE